MDTPKYDVDTLKSRGAGRARELPRRLGLTPEELMGKRILEIGCGNGETTIATREIYKADVLGVDPYPRFSGRPWAHEPIFVKADIIDVGDIGTFDAIQSYTVWEHIDRPKQALQKAFKLLKPGGRAYLVYNLYRGATASHLSKYIDIPWVHLLHTDDEIRAMMRRQHGLDRGPSWVNKLTWAHYLAYFAEIGFNVERCWYTVRKVEPAFYEQHRAKLSPYPIEDLERNFMHVRLTRD